MKKVNILRVGISVLGYQELVEKIKIFLESNKQNFIVTPNPEILLKAYLPKYRDEILFHILNKANVAVADGFGIKLAGWLSGNNIPRITGADLTKDILEIAEKGGYQVVFVIPINGLSSKEEIKRSLDKKYPRLKYRIFYLKQKNGVKNYKNERLKQFQPDILLATLGAPHQEKFIFYNLKEFPSIKLAMGIGGALEFITGKISRAPKIMRCLGLEWIWRLYQQPWRIKRIINAVVVFLYQFLKWKFIQPFIYRHNVACLLYKKEKDAYKILVVERKGQRGHWQIPQGGVEGWEKITESGSRELKEELNTDKFIPEGGYKLNFKYRFPSGYQAKNGGYRGQKQDLLIAKFTGNDEDITINFWDHRSWKWVDIKLLLKTVYPARREASKLFLNKFHEHINK